MSDHDSMLDTQHISEHELEAIHAQRRAGQTPSSVALLLYHRDGVEAVPLGAHRALVIGRDAPADIRVRDGSLSRQHASVALVNGEVWIEDLQSTNGTWIDGARVERSVVRPGQAIAFGAVAASVHHAGVEAAGIADIDGHELFVRQLDAEVARARLGQRCLGLLLLQGDAQLGSWLPAVRAQLRPFDRVGLYGAGTVELILPDAERGALEQMGRQLVATAPGLRGGLALFPDHGGSAEALLEAVRHQTTRAGAGGGLAVAAPPGYGAELDVAAGSRSPLFSLNPQMRALQATIERVAASSIPVIIVGETGSGKEVVARALHSSSPRRDRPLVSINCGAIPASLVESTLFGHEKGAFTGADERAPGLFEAADGGTLLLDEIGELPPGAQAALLRVLETRRLTRVGGHREIEVDVRVLAATHRDLEALSRAGQFRQDLLYRLNALTLEVLPLRQRLEDIAPLAQQFVGEASASLAGAPRQLGAEALAVLQRHSWPGNVRELRNVIERAVVIAQGSVIDVEDLPAALRRLAPDLPETAEATVEPGASSVADSGAINLRAELDRHERELILKALQRVDWDRSAAARLLGLPLRTLARKIQTHDLRRGAD